MSGSASPNHSKSAQELYNSGKGHCQNGQYDVALLALREAAVKTPDSAAVHFWLGKALVGQGDTAAAVAAFQRSARLDPANVKPHLEMGKAQVAADQLGAASVSFRQAQRLSPQSAEPLRQMATVLIKQCQYDAALGELQRALPLEPDAALTHVFFGRVYELKGMAHQADQFYRQAERLDPCVYAQAQFANGAQLEAAGRLGDAIKQYRYATQTDPAFLEAFVRLGGACLKKCHLTDAVEAFRAAILLNPKCFPAQYGLGWTLLELSQVTLKTVLFKTKAAPPPDEAVQALRRAVELKPDEATAHYTLGKAYQASGVRHLAREQFERVLALAPGSEDAASAREALHLL